VSRVSHAGRLKSLERKDGPTGWQAEFYATLHEMQREQDAAVTLVKVAQALAGTVMQPRYVDNGDRDPAPELAARSPPPELFETTARRVPRARPRLDHRTEATLDEVLKEPWQQEEQTSCGLILVPMPSQVPPPEGWVDPWGGSEFLFPSYANSEEE
jgi:hypothetical protein